MRLWLAGNDVEVACHHRLPSSLRSLPFLFLSSDVTPLLSFFSSSGLDRFLPLPSFPVSSLSRGRRWAGATTGRTSTVAGVSSATLVSLNGDSKLQCIMDTCTHFTRSQSSYNSFIIEEYEERGGCFFSCFGPVGGLSSSFYFFMLSLPSFKA